MARPKKADQERRTEQTKERWTLAEIEHLNAQAKRCGLTRAEYIRRRSLGEPIRAKSDSADPALVVAINRVGNNVNQIARSVHRGSDFQQYYREVGEKLHHVLDLVLERYSP